MFIYPAANFRSAWSASCALHSGPQTTAVVFPQYLKDTKQHWHDLLYVSRHHPTKRPSVVFFHHPSSRKLKFGEVENIYKHSYALKEYMWATLNLFDGEQFDSWSGLWWSENSMGQKMPVFFFVKFLILWPQLRKIPQSGSWMSLPAETLMIRGNLKHLDQFFFVLNSGWQICLIPQGNYLRQDDAKSIFDSW